MNKNSLLLTSLVVLLSGCGLLGPSYEKPVVIAPTNWNNSSATTKTESVNLADQAWWRKFNDPVLNQLIESALTNNNNLQIAMGNVLQAQASLSKANIAWLPMVNIGGAGFTGQSFNPGFQNLSANPQLSGVQTNNPQNFSGYGAGFMPTYTLNVFEEIKQGQIAKANLAMQQQAKNAVRLGVISQVAGSYFYLLGLKQQLILQQQLLSDAKEMRKYNLIQYQNGSASEFNLTGIDQYIAGLEAKIPSIQDAVTQTENALQVLTNNNPGKIKTVRNFNEISTKGIIPVNLPSDVLKTRPDVMAAEYQLQVANANIGAVTAMFFPTINLTGMLGQGSVQLSNLFNAGGDFWMGQLAAGMPLFNMGLYAEEDKAKAGYYSTYYNYVQTVRSAFSQVDNGLSNNDSLNKIESQQQVAMSKAQDLYRLAMIQYQQGSAAYSDTVGMKLNIDYAAANLNQVKMQQMNSIVNLYQVLGGGYLAESSLTQVKKFNDSHDI